MLKFVKNENGKISDDNWFNKCKLEQIPYIEISVNKLYSNIHWDFITLNRENEEIIKNNFVRYKSQIEHYFNHYKNEKSSIELLDTEFRFYKIENHKAEDLSRDIYDLIVRMLEDK